MSGRELLICLRHVIPALQHLQADLMAQRDDVARPADHDGNGHSDAAPPSIERQLRVQEAAKILGCSTSHVGQLCDRGEIGCHRDGRWVRIGESQLKEYLERTHVALESNGR